MAARIPRSRSSRARSPDPTDRTLSRHNPRHLHQPMRPERSASRRAAQESTMSPKSKINRIVSGLAAAAIGLLIGVPAQSAGLNISDSPLFLSTGAEPLVMLAMSADEQLYLKAYTDFDDVDGDNL